MSEQPTLPGLGRSEYLLPGGDVLVGVHWPYKCQGRPCPIHRQSAHARSIGRQYWRDDRGIMERICEHGVGHPDPDSPWPEDSGEWVHGCDGCCADPETGDDDGDEERGQPAEPTGPGSGGSATGEPEGLRARLDVTSRMRVG